MQDKQAIDIDDFHQKVPSIAYLLEGQIIGHNPIETEGNKNTITVYKKIMAKAFIVGVSPKSGLIASCFLYFLVYFYFSCLNFELFK